ncbi:MAG: hypothetical protein LBI48_03320 [Burkholderiaceae bacterium]|jgi:hypothetical protein|nr:hypothetical protein [Burkholderiaceae bacterium]
MLIPRYWATHTTQHGQGDSQFAIQRFGWSLASQQEAQDMARARADEALREKLAGGAPIRREPKVAYNGAEGVPIREEIVDTHGSIVITRNSYGARCMNVANVCFIDVDQKPEKLWKNPGFRIFFMALIVLASLILLIIPMVGRSYNYDVTSLPLPLPCITIISLIIVALLPEFLAYSRRITVKKVTGWLAELTGEDKNAGFRLYRTPAGFRIIATHKTFDPESEEVARLFERLRADPRYRQMCVRQKCFRARVSAKPWRAHVYDRIKGGVWPPDSADKMAQRAHWISRYEFEAALWSACRFVAAVGSTAMPTEVAAAVRLHDQLCEALSDKLCA